MADTSETASDAEHMTAIAIARPGGPDVLVPQQLPVPYPYEHEILIRVAAAGINRPDVLQRMGLYPAPKGAPATPGLEVAGTVVRVGRHVSRFKVGDAVCALLTGGGYAEFATVHETNALPVPKGLSMVEAAGIPETFFTVWSNVFDRAGLKPGEVFLVHGGTSGIGTTAVQLARAFGAKVIATAGSDDKCARIRDLGADLAINYNSEDYVTAIKSFTEGHGADVILDMVGGDYIERNWQAAAVEGRIVQIAFLNGARAEADFTRLMLKRLTHTGSTLRARDVSFKAAIAEALHQKVWPLLESGRIKVIVDGTFPLDQASEAHRRMESNAHIGKIVLTVSSR